MCGIFGGIGPDFNIQIVKMLAILNEARGRDSHGLWNEKHYWKNLGLARESLKMESLQNKEGLYLLGHTRFATIGAVSKRNCHPFNYGHIWGAHNGGIYNFKELAQKKGVYANMYVDSEIIFWGLDKYGVDWFKELNGYWGLVWTDLRHPEYVYLMAHGNTVAMSVGAKQIYFSSDPEHLSIAGLKSFKLKEDSIYIVNTKTCVINKQKIKGLKEGEPIKTTPWFDRYNDSKFGTSETYEEHASKSATASCSTDYSPPWIKKTVFNTSQVGDEIDKEKFPPLTIQEWTVYLRLDEELQTGKIQMKDYDEYEALNYRAYLHKGKVQKVVTT